MQKALDDLRRQRCHIHYNYYNKPSITCDFNAYKQNVQIYSVGTTFLFVLLLLLHAASLLVDLSAGQHAVAQHGVMLKATLNWEIWDFKDTL